MEGANDTKTGVAAAVVGVKVSQVGYDSFDRQYTSVDEMWEREVSGRTLAPGEQKDAMPGVQAEIVDEPAGSVAQWYKKGIQYWEAAKGEGYDDVLGGLGYVHEIDVEDSLLFIEKLRKERGLIGEGRCIGTDSFI